MDYIWIGLIFVGYLFGVHVGWSNHRDYMRMRNYTVPEDLDDEA